MNSTHDAEIIHVNVINTQLQYSNKTDLQSNFFRNKLKRNLTQSRLWLTLTGKFRKMPCHIAQIYAPSKANTANVRMFSPFNVVYDCLIHYIRLFLITKLNLCEWAVKQSNLILMIKDILENPLLWMQSWHRGTTAMI